MSQADADIEKFDAGAFRDLVEAHSEKIIRLCHSFVNNTEDAEDIAQEVFLEVYHSIDAFRGEASLTSWIYRIAVNKSLNFLRAKKRRSFILRFGQVFSSGGQVENIASDETPDSRHESNEAAEALRHAVDALSENQRVAFTLHKYDGLPQKEIADIMGLSQASVESLIHRAMQNVRKKLIKIYR